MGIRVAVNHRTHYRYDRPVALGPQWIRLRPAEHTRAAILSYSLKVTPGKHLIHWQQDAHNNHLARLVITDRTQQITVEVNIVAELAATNPFDSFLEPGSAERPFEYSPGPKR